METGARSRDAESAASCVCVVECRLNDVVHDVCDVCMSCTVPAGITKTKESESGNDDDAIPFNEIKPITNTIQTRCYPYSLLDLA